ncbi:MAG: Citrate transporter, partial [Herbinix sp.]|nr:Citrate transporter [Herbinix sp.]
VIKKVDYSLLLTFICFFVFVGNIGNIPVIRDFLASLLKGREFIVSLLASQIISNVPAAVLLSAFTNDYKAIILGTDLGGLGTLVASLASLISYKFYLRTTDAHSGKYLRAFTLYNLGFLVILCLFYYLWNDLFLLI